jgi:protein gp37
MLTPLHVAAPQVYLAFGDIFGKGMSDEWVDRFFAVCALCPHHTFQIRTEHSARMRAYFETMDRAEKIRAELRAMLDGDWVSSGDGMRYRDVIESLVAKGADGLWPLKNVIRLE